MRNIVFTRPKRLMAAASGLNVTADGIKVGTLGNGRTCSFELDENAHEVLLKGGFLSSDFQCSVHIPAGHYSYRFQIDIVGMGNKGNLPFIRPGAEEELREDIRSRMWIGLNTMNVLFDDRIRQYLREDPNARVRLFLGPDKWIVGIISHGQVHKVFEQQYASTRGGLIAAFDNSLQKGAVKSEQETISHVMDQYLRFLPDYEVCADMTLRFKG